MHGGTSVETVARGANELVGPFELQRLLGRGGGGEAWAGVHLPTGTEVVLKRPASGDLQATARLDREIMLSSRLVHPCVVRVLDAHRSGVGREPFLVLARARRGSLAQHDIGRDPSALVQALLDVLAGLGHLHARGVLHLDVKPSNLFVDEGPEGARVWVGDLGAAILRWASEGTHVHPLAGTSGYMAPEHRAGDRGSLGPWSDLWSLGVTARRLAGEAAPDWLEGWLDGCLAATPRARFRSAAHAAQALRGAAPGPCRHALERCSRGASGYVAGLAEQLAQTGTRPFVQELRTHEVGVGDNHDDRASEPREMRGPEPSWPDEHADESEARDGEAEASELPPGLGAGAVGVRRPPMVGRKEQCAALEAAWRRAVSGEHVIVQIEGPSGAGTTRLAEWQADRAQERDGALALEVRLGAGGGGLAGGLRRWALGPGGEATGAGQEHLRRRLSAEGVELRGDLTGELAALLDRQVVPETRLALVLERVVEALRRRSPVVLLIDGLDEAAGPLTWLEGLLAQLVRQGPHGVLVVITHARPARGVAAERELRLEAGVSIERLSVPPLERLDTERLASRLLGFAGPSSQQVAARSAGLPGHLVEHVTAWVQAGVLVSGPGGLALAAGAAPPVPSTLADRVRQRIWEAVEPLGERERRALVASALLGGDDGRGVLARVLSSCDLPDPPLGALLASELAVRTGVGWRWTLPGADDALLVPGPEHQALLAACASALDRGGKLRGEACVRIARLRARARDPLASLDAMARVVSVDLSPDVARSLAELLTEIGPTIEGTAERALVAGLMARMLFERGDHAGARDEADRARAAAGAEALDQVSARRLASAQFQALHTLALMQVTEGQTGDEALGLAHEAIGWAGRVSPDDRLAAQLLVGRLLIISGRSNEAIQQLQSWLDESGDASDDTRWRGWILQADACSNAGLPEQAAAPCQRAIAAMQAAGGHWLLGQAYNTLADIRMRQRRFDEAVPVLLLALRELYPRTPTAGYVRANLAFCHLQLGEFEQAAGWLDEGLSYLATDARHRLWCLLQSLRLPLLARSSLDELDACCDAIERATVSQRLVFAEPAEAATLAAEAIAGRDPRRSARLLALAQALAVHVEDPSLLVRLRPRWSALVS